MNVRLIVRLLCAPAALMVFAGAVAAAQPPSTLSIAFVGDIELSGAAARLIERGVDPFAGVAAALGTADLRVGNLECVVATGGAPVSGKPFVFRAPPLVLPLLRRHFNAVSLANNHSGDYGPVAFGEMLDLLDAAGVAHFGGGHDLAQAHRPLVLERHGLRVALLGYNEFMPRSFEADVDRGGVAWSDDEDVRRDVAAARRVADLVIPFMHWGQEHEKRANQRQRALARLMIDAGADAVVGGHPHVVQDTEIYRGKPIFYSIGNFLFDGFDTPETTTGWLLRLDLDRGGVRGWRAQPVRLGPAGTPRTVGPASDLCWRRGAAVPVACAGPARPPATRRR